MLHLQTVRDILPCFAATGHNTYTKSWNTYLCKSETLMYISQRV